MKSIHPVFSFGLFFILLSFFIINCKSPDEDVIPVVANFTAANAVGIGITIKCGECVFFEDRSSGDIGALFWDFEGGDPATSEGDFRVRVCYKDPGKFDVSLSVNAGEDRITRQEYVCVLGKEPENLSASFVSDRIEIVQGQVIQLTDESTGDPDSWSWAIEGPGAILTSQDQNPSFTLEDPGIYTVTLTIGRGGDQDVEERVGYITVLKYLDFACQIISSESNTGLTSTFTYNNLDQLIRLDEFFNGSLFTFNLYTWNNDGLVELIENFNSDQIRIGREEYAYNDQGILKEQEFFDSSGLSLSKYDFIIDGNLITGGTIEQPGFQGGIFRSGVEYTYDADNANVIEERKFTIENGQTTQRLTFEFDDKFRPFVDMQVDPWPTRGLLNNPIRTRFINADDEIFIERIHEYEYNEFGRATREERTSFGTTTEFRWDFDCKKRE